MAKMNYSEYKNTYKKSIKKWPEITTLFNRDDVKIICTEKTFSRNGTRGRWYLNDLKEVNYTWINYTNNIDAYFFFKNLSSYSRVNCNYTKYGYIPVECIEISPDKTVKVVYSFTFE